MLQKHRECALHLEVTTSSWNTCKSKRGSQLWLVYKVFAQDEYFISNDEMRSCGVKVTVDKLRLHETRSASLGQGLSNVRDWLMQQCLRQSVFAASARGTVFFAYVCCSLLSYINLVTFWKKDLFGLYYKALTFSAASIIIILYYPRWHHIISKIHAKYIVT